MSEPLCMDGPFEIDVKVHITDGSNTGVVTVGMAAGTIPTPDKIRLAITEAEKAAKGAKMRLMNRHEFIIETLNAGPIAAPGPKDFPASKAG